MRAGLMRLISRPGPILALLALLALMLVPGCASMKITASNPAARELVIGVNQGSGAFISMNSSAPLDFRTNGTRQLRIQAADIMACEVAHVVALRTILPEPAGAGGIIAATNFSFFSDLGKSED